MAAKSKPSRSQADSQLTRQDLLSILHSAVVEYEQAGGEVELYAPKSYDGAIIALRGVDLDALNEGVFTLRSE